MILLCKLENKLFKLLSSILSVPAEGMPFVDLALITQYSARENSNSAGTSFGKLVVF